ncbi:MULTISPECIES: nitroreductase [unclassified Ekhidna]|uniref:nitroreductase family protein n=1 Tax=unclassified Ekhidna TaxID=2632188 RepID=UPI0032DFFD52
MSELNKIIRKRRSVYPLQYIDKPIPREILKELLLNANHAPTHRLTEPWRFKVFTGEAKSRLGEFLAQKYEEITPDADPSKVKKIKLKPDQSGAVLAIVLHRDSAERVPEWEEIAAIACAVQNIWISLDQYGLGGYWSSPVLSKFLGEHVHLEENETCIGFFYMGYCEPSDRIVIKKPIEAKVEWIEE